MNSAEPTGTVSRAAFFGGIFAGAVICFVGLWFVPKLELPRWASLPVEFLTVAVALFVVTRMWRVSAASSAVDSGKADRDPGE